MIIKMTANQMTLQGHQIGTRDGASVHYIQSWGVRMTADSSVSMPLTPSCDRTIEKAGRSPPFPALCYRLKAARH